MKSAGRMTILGKVWRFFWASREDRPIVKELAKGRATGPATETHTMGPSCIGICEPPSANGKRIIIRSNLPLVDLLDTFIHEQLHAASYPMLSEEWVTEAGTDLARNILLHFDVSRKGGQQ